MKPQICNILGVELEEIFKIQLDCDFLEAKIISRGENGYQVYMRIPGTDQWDIMDCCSLIKLIDNPDLIIRKKEWTIQDIKDATAIQRLFPFYKYIARQEDFGLLELSASPQYWLNRYNISINGQCFPMIKRGEVFKIDDILNWRMV